MTLTEAARIIGTTPDNLRGAIARGALKAEKHGRDWWVQPAEVERYKRENRRRIGTRQGGEGMNDFGKAGYPPLDAALDEFAAAEDNLRAALSPSTERSDEPTRQDRAAIRETFVQIVREDFSEGVADDIIGAFDQALGATP